jgi:hypothetical protein
LKSTPAEAAPGETVDIELEALYVGPEPQNLDASELVWQNCLLRKPLSTAGAINPECLVKSGEGISELGTGATASRNLAADACRLFGPTPPDPEPGEPPLRAADSDTTGGFYQPVTVRSPAAGGSTYAVGVTRLSCGIGAATIEQVTQYNQRYRRNENPEIEGIDLVDGKARASLLTAVSQAMVRVSPGKTVNLETLWYKCPERDECGDAICSIDETVDDCFVDCATQRGCAGAERYLMFDPEARELTQRREQLRVSWFATAGEFEHDRTGANVSSDDRASGNRWTAPQDQGFVSFWIVVRDDRRGVGWRQFQIEVQK